jgi:hypothetical protein
MDFICNDLILVIFHFVPIENRLRFIKMGQRYLDIVRNYITSPEWIYDQIDQFIKNHVVVDFAVRIGAPVEYFEHLRNHTHGNHCRDERSGGCHFADNLLAQQLEIGVMKCLYVNGEPRECPEHEFCYWHPGRLVTDEWSIDSDSVQNAPPNCSSLSGSDYRDYVTDCLKKQSEADYYAYWTTSRNHASNIMLVGSCGVMNYTGCACVKNTIIPIHSAPESIGIIVHNMTGIEQIRSNLLDYDIAHLQLFYVVDFIAANQVFYGNRVWIIQNIDLLRYSLFVSRVLQDHIQKDAEVLMANRVGLTKYVFMIHSEIESKAAEAAKYIMLFNTN